MSEGAPGNRGAAGVRGVGGAGAPDAAARGALVEALGLKDVARAGWVRGGVADPESVAAHAWGVAWLVLALCPPEVDRGRALAIAVLHDLAEVRVGDLTPHDPVAPEEKARREAEALAAMVAPLPDAAALVALWREYQEGSTPEGRFVKACDKLDMGLQAGRYAAAQGIDTAEWLASARVALGTHELGAWLDPEPEPAEDAPGAD